MASALAPNEEASEQGEGHGTQTNLTACKTREPRLLIALHGLSRQPLVMRPAELAASNAQLIGMKQTVATAKWKVGTGGIRLKDRILLVA